MADASLAWISLLVLGAVHGINPAMGWLFAVARGLQVRDRREVWRALGPLALGHAAAIAAAVLLATALAEVLPIRSLKWVVAGALLVVGIDALRRHRHVRLGGMRVTGRELAVWSFLVASVHGAGLMVLPFMLGASGPAPGGGVHGHHAAASGADSGLLLAGAPGGVDPAAILAPLIHTLGYLVVTASLSVVVYEKVGLRILRRAWINVNALWAAALIGAGLVTVLT